MLHHAVYRSWRVNSHKPIHGNLELEAVIVAKGFLDLHWWKQSSRCYNHRHKQAGNPQETPRGQIKSSSKYNTRSLANAEKQVCPSVSIKVWTVRISCKVMVFLSICFLLCYYTVRLHFFFVKTQKIMSVSSRWSCWFYRFSCKYSQRICAFISSFYLVISMLYMEHTNEVSKQRKTMPR